MTSPTWLADTRTSYDTVAESYAEIVGDGLDSEPFVRGVFIAFADLVRAGGGGPVADIGCGPGRLTAHLHDLGLAAFGLDLSPGMIEIARRKHPELHFEVGSMTELELAEASLGGLLAWFCLIHIPDSEIAGVLGRFYRALRPGGTLLIGFHAGDGARLKTEGYGGHPMKVYVHRRPAARVSGWLREAGFYVEAEIRHFRSADAEGVFLLARRP